MVTMHCNILYYEVMLDNIRGLIENGLLTFNR